MKNIYNARVLGVVMNCVSIMLLQVWLLSVDLLLDLKGCRQKIKIKIMSYEKKQKSFFSREIDEEMKMCSDYKQKMNRRDVHIPAFFDVLYCRKGTLHYSHNSS